MKKELLLIGGGGHCKASVEVIEAEGKFKIAGIVDIEEKFHRVISGYKIIACDKDLPRLIKEYKYFLITIGQINSADKRIEKYKWLKKMNAELPSIISPLAYVSKHAKISEGTIVMHNAFLNSGVKIGKNCIINTNAIIEHDTTVEDHCHISTGAILNGSCCIGTAVFIGSNSSIINNLHITSNTIIGAGSVVVESINKSGVYMGNPVRRLEKK